MGGGIFWEGVSEWVVTHYSITCCLHQTHEKAFSLLESVNPIHDGGGRGKKPPSTGFSPVISPKVGINPQNFVTFSFNPFATLV